MTDVFPGARYRDDVTGEEFIVNGIVDADGDDDHDGRESEQLVVCEYQNGDTARYSLEYFRSDSDFVLLAPPSESR